MKSYLYVANPWWQSSKKPSGIIRSRYLDKMLADFPQKLIQIITGLRRVGKSTLAHQLISEIIKNKKIDPKDILFFSIEEPSLADKSVLEIINEYRSIWDIATSKKIYVFIDEIQYRDKWEVEIKSLYDSQNIKFILTGSSALLLSEKTSLLTGRYLKTHINPLDFNEFLKFKKTKINLEDQHLLAKKMESYFQIGGMPEFVLSEPNKYLETTVESILFKDIVTKFQLRNPQILLDLLYLLADRIGSTTSVLKICKILEINKDTALQYINYLEKVYLISSLTSFSHLRNKQIYNPDKIYFTDIGMASAYASKINYGAWAESVLFNYLKNKASNESRSQLGYWSEEKLEIDFVLKSKNIEVFESKWVDRIEEINFKPLEKLLKTMKVDKITYVTKSLSGQENIMGKSVDFVPLAELVMRRA